VATLPGEGRKGERLTQDLARFLARHVGAAWPARGDYIWCVAGVSAGATY
jgi:hypothetical protein